MLAKYMAQTPCPSAMTPMTAANADTDMAGMVG